MRRTPILAVVVTLLSSLLLLVGPAPAGASGRGIHYGMNAKKVAKKIGCKGATRPESTAAPRFHIKDSVVCLLDLKRVNVITFKDKRGQTRWEDMMIPLAAAQRYPQHWASADGVTIVAKNGNRAAACAGKRALKGARHVGAYRATARGWTRLRC